MAEKIHYVLIKHGKYILYVLIKHGKYILLLIFADQLIVFKNSGDNSIMERFFFLRTEDE